MSSATIMRMVALQATLLLLLLDEAYSQEIRLTCPSTIGKNTPFNITAPTTIALDKTSGVGSLCTLTLQIENGLFIPIARSYDGNNWERAGGSFIATSPEWVCDGTTTCSSIIPPGLNYVLATRSLSITPIASEQVARFLESASFGATPNDLATWGDQSFAQYIKDQVNTPLTSHRELFRTLANPRWTFHKPEFGGRLNPCAPNSTWRRQVLTTKDLSKFLNIRRVSDRWEVKIDGHVRTMVPQLRLINTTDTIVDGGTYQFCSSEEEILRGLFKAKVKNNCRTLNSADLIVDFPDGYIPANSLKGLIPALGQNPLWKSTSSRNPEYMFSDTITPSVIQPSSKSLRSATAPFNFLGGLFCRPLFKYIFRGLFCRNDEPSVPPTSAEPPSPTIPSPPSQAPVPPPLSPAPAPVQSPTVTLSCELALSSTTFNTPLFAKTSDGIWLQNDPRIDMKSNTVNEPLPDGGFGMLQAKQTSYCSNVARTFFNEDKCKMSNVPACSSGSTNRSASVMGAIICGSPGEVNNDLSSGDNWLDVSSIDAARSTSLRLPVDTTSPELLSRQRELIWSEISMNAADQLRQRIAFALLHIFSLPKSSIAGESLATEIFLFYYDIFVRNAFGNYGDILKEISFNPLNAQSLSYIDSRSVANAFASTNTIIFPDENYARELMQLFTIGLFELQMDGTPLVDLNGTVQTYTSDDVLSYSKIWTGFRLNAKRANVEAVENENRYDPMRLEADRRDRFPKSDLANGYIGDYYPLCTDLPVRSFLRIGAKYRLLGSSRRPELRKQAWQATNGTQMLTLATTSSLYSKLCSSSLLGICTYPSVVVLDINLKCSGLECQLDTIQVIQVGSVFYEYIRIPCVEQSFFTIGIKAIGLSRTSAAICTNPALAVASEACCPSNVASLSQKFAIPSCLVSGELMTKESAQSRCATVGRKLCDYDSIAPTVKCPSVGFYWTSESCQMRVKVTSSGQIAIVHDFPVTSFGLTKTSPNYFKVYWENGQYPSMNNLCGGGQCEVYENSCICTITVENGPVFTALPANAAEILEKLRVGHPDPLIFNENTYTSTTFADYRAYSTVQTCCGTDTVFEVWDANDQKKFLRNLKSTVRIAGTTFNFRNPPQFNSILSTEFSITDAYYETEAAINHLLYHQNTPPFLAYRFIQRFGVSNPTPRYILAVATAFKSGSYSNQGLSFGQGRYGDMEATTAAILLDREVRSVVLDNDPSHGGLREPILKVLSFMRATEFNSSVPLVELDFMDVKVGQMAYEQTSVFSFFRPEYSPSELSSTGLTAPESQTLSSSNIIGLLNGLYSLTKYGLNECYGGFGTYGDCSTQSGLIASKPDTSTSPTDVVRDLSNILTGGRMTEGKQQNIAKEIAKQPNASIAYQLALQLIVSSPEFHSTSSLDLLSPADKTPRVPNGVPPTPGYKAVIHLFFLGGCDSFNVLVPSSGCGTLYQSYVKTRGSIGLKPNDTLPLSGDSLETQQPCSSFAVHKGLSILQKLYDQADLTFLANVGVLTQYVNRSDYSKSTKTPLFSHNSMQDEVSRLDPMNLVSGTGSLGRMADVLQAKGYMTRRTAIDSPTSNLASRSAVTPPIVTLGRRGVSRFNVAPSSSTMNTTIQQLNNGTSGIYGDLWSTLMKRSISQSEDLLTTLNTQPKSVFPSTLLGGRLKIAAQMIASRVKSGVDRDIFYVPFGGFDTHNEVSKSLTGRFYEFNVAFGIFITELKALGVWDNVAIVQTSDFGRTMTGNSGGGTDHGWGGNYWLAGGGVKGRRIVGKYPPTFSLDYEYNIDRGRLIPTTSWDSIFNSISEWMGIDSESELMSILPNRNQFNDVFPASTLFE